MSNITARLTQSRDVSGIDSLVRKTLGGEANSGALLGSSLLSLTAVDDKDTVVGYLCLDDVPCTRLRQSNEAAEAWVQDAAASRFSLGSGAFVRMCATSRVFEFEATTALLRSAFMLIPSLQTLLMAAGGELSFAEPGLAAVFNRVAAHKDSGVVLYHASRDSVVLPLAIRPARVEDHDDMLPILQRCEQAFPALAKLPESSRPQEPFALTRVVAGQDEHNRVLVAEAEGKLVGFVVMTSDVDTSSLAETFDLHPYDNFLPQDVYEGQYEAARFAVREKKVELLKAELARRKAEEGTGGGGEEEEGEGAGAAGQGVAVAAQTDPEAEEGEGGDGGEGAGTGTNTGAGEAAGEGGEGEEGGRSAQDEAAAAKAAAKAAAEAEAEEALLAQAEPTEEEIREEMVAIFGGQPIEAEPTVFAVTMLCMHPDFETQAVEFLGPAFEAFESKLYAVVTLPHDSLEPALMDAMTRVAPQPGSLFPEVLFMLNRHALLPDFSVRPGEPSDLEAVSVLVAGMPNAADIADSFTGAASAGTAVVAVCQGEIVGLVTVNPEVDLELLQANFGLSSHVDLAYQPKMQHGEIDMYTMNPIFVRHHRTFMAGAMRLLGKTALYYALPPGQQPPDMQEVLEQVAPRHRTGGDKQLQADFALYVFTRQAAFKRRRSVNSQIVIAGASECGLAVLERLLLDPELQFNYLTLLAPGGIKVGGMACQYTAGVIARLGLEARVLLLDAEMTGLDRAARVIDLSDGSQLCYNQLVIATGLQDQSRYRFAEADPDVAGLLVTELELAADFTMNDAMVMNSILVYGGALGGYHALSVLEAKGAGTKMRFVVPPEHDSAMVRVLRHLAEEAGIPLPEPEPREISSLTVVQPLAAELRATATLVDPADPGPREELPVDLVAGCEPPAVSRALFTVLNDASLVFDGRLVVDGAFRTNDPNIYGGGTIAKLSRRYGGMPLEHYNSRDVGSHLAASLVQQFITPTPGGPPAPDPTQPPPPPALHRARAIGCSLPGGNNFVYSGCPVAVEQPSTGAPEGGYEMSTKTDRGLTRITLDRDGCVYSVMYLGRVPVSAPRLGSLVGLHANYLNQLSSKFHAGDVQDLLTFLMDPWAELLLHDSFGGLRETLLEMALASVAQGGKDTEGGLTGWVTNAQDAVLEFVRARAAEMPAYSVPGAART